MSELEIEKTFNGRYVSVNTYAKRCDVTPSAIHIRINASSSGKIQEGTDGYLEQTALEEAEGVFIDTELYPPKKATRGRKKKTN